MWRNVREGLSDSYPSAGSPGRRRTPGKWKRKSRHGTVQAQVEASNVKVLSAPDLIATVFAKGNIGEPSITEH
jgi:hypothetical protein